MIRKAFSIILLLLALSPVVINLCGWHLFAYYQQGDKDYIIGAVSGGIHLAKADHTDFSSEDQLGIDQALGIQYHELLKSGSLLIYAEGLEDPYGASSPLHNFILFPIDKHDPADAAEYAFVTFPQLLLIAFTLLIILLLNHGELNKGRKAKKA
ncbi:hypothetical protein SAMN02745181_0422 [Rubritalea squalenifaciens DSM 18772]|uniref:Uncharacterized protein n=1 Tax=Rubritalea squalenifaciens DSM 18772 TaxID=1123071 RepID=A0A1M6C9R5_9BACT|nr:hypothetical protein [Rubritalea squalenifaciens]SHI57524.1 hypothetical protein SAMN02745181_0422 [Rubritalea squalenifaciens DSM 18772]